MWKLQAHARGREASVSRASPFGSNQPNYCSPCHMGASQGSCVMLGQGVDHGDIAFRSCRANVISDLPRISKQKTSNKSPFSLRSNVNCLLAQPLIKQGPLSDLRSYVALKCNVDIAHPGCQIFTWVLDCCIAKYKHLALGVQNMHQLTGISANRLWNGFRFTYPFIQDYFLSALARQISRVSSPVTCGRKKIFSVLAHRHTQVHADVVRVHIQILSSAFRSSTKRIGVEMFLTLAPQSTLIPYPKHKLSVPLGKYLLPQIDHIPMNMYDRYYLIKKVRPHDSLTTWNTP